MRIRRIKHQVDRRRPRFQTPGCGLILIVLVLSALLLLTRGARGPQRASQPSPPPSTTSEKAVLPFPIAAPPPPIPTGAAEDGCPQGCAEPPPGCDIKGNISLKTGERIYHIPGQRFYGKTVISPEDGEAWFCTEAEARSNGWRKSKI